MSIFGSSNNVPANGLGILNLFGKVSLFQEQYKFIYDTLEEYCRGIDSRFPVSDLANKIKEKTLKDKKIKKNAYASEYAVRGFPIQTLYFSG